MFFSQEIELKLSVDVHHPKRKMRAQGEIFAGLVRYRENLSNLLIHRQVLIRRNRRLQWQLENIPHQKFQSKSNIVLKAVV